MNYETVRLNIRLDDNNQQNLEDRAIVDQYFEDGWGLWSSHMEDVDYDGKKTTILVVRMVKEMEVYVSN